MNTVATAIHTLSIAASILSEYNAIYLVDYVGTQGSTISLKSWDTDLDILIHFPVSANKRELRKLLDKYAADLTGPII